MTRVSLYVIQLSSPEKSRDGCFSNANNISVIIELGLGGYESLLPVRLGP